MQSYKIRTAHPRDAPAIEEMLIASYPTLMVAAYDPAVLDPVLEIITKANLFLLSSKTYYVAEFEDGLVVGCGGWTIESPPGVDDVESQVGHLRHFGTHPDWTRRGIGRAIFWKCESAARSANVKAMEVCSSLNAAKFYAAIGFAIVKRITIGIGTNQFPSMLMRKNRLED
jgi:N-acetylglutamate synthase-like GNAT family acetyltransferase